MIESSTSRGLGLEAKLYGLGLEGPDLGLGLGLGLGLVTYGLGLEGCIDNLSASPSN